jgi:nucleoside-diphosphate-sugar epimerase
VLVTGSGGFIGRHVVQLLLARGYRVVGLDLRPSDVAHPQFQEIRCDLRDEAGVVSALQRCAPTLLIHLAARTDLEETRSLLGYDANMQGVEHLIQAIRATPSLQRWICTSSQLVCRIGYQPKGDEDYYPATLYGESKVETERIVRRSDGGGITWSIVRPTTIWGPGMNAHYVRFFRMIQAGYYFHVGGGPRFKSYGYVGNTAWQYLRLAEAPAAAVHRRTFYLADYEPISLEAWADSLGAAVGAPGIRTLPLWAARAGARVGDWLNFLGLRRVPFNSFRLANVLAEYIVDLEPTKAVCGKLPFTMHAGVQETARWLESLGTAAPRAAAQRSATTA